MNRESGGEPPPRATENGFRQGVRDLVDARGVGFQHDPIPVRVQCVGRADDSSHGETDDLPWPKPVMIERAQHAGMREAAGALPPLRRNGQLLAAG